MLDNRFNNKVERLNIKIIGRIAKTINKIKHHHKNIIIIATSSTYSQLE
jgi:hypothetical protein